MPKPRKPGGTGHGLPSLGVRLPPQQWVWLKQRAKAAGSSRSQVVRDLIEEAMSCRALPADEPSIVDAFADIAASVPVEAWKTLPPDLTDQLDHYIYGTQKR